MNVLTNEAIVLCDTQAPKLHGGKVMIAGETKLTVNGNPVILQMGIESKTVSGCTTVPPPAGNKPCVTVRSVTAGVAMKLTVNGNGVILGDKLVGQTDGVSPGKLHVTNLQEKLTAI